MNTTIIIPARARSSRLPYKPLAEIAGHTMLYRIWSIAQASCYANQVIIATDCQKIANHARSFAAKVVMTNECLTGTDRVSMVAKTLAPDDIIINLQGDAVLTPPWIIDDIIQVMTDRKIKMATPTIPLQGERLYRFRQHKAQGSTTGTTVVFNKDHQAIYFSKQILPFYREWSAESIVYLHIGLYGYRQATLMELSALKPTPLEEIEKLEQLRAIEHRIPIQVVQVDYHGRTHGSVDNPEDIQRVEKIIAQEGELVL